MNINKKFLIVRPKYGLCNQIYSISKGIIFGMITNRDIIFSKFQLDYRDENNSCSFHEIINIDNLKNILNKYNIKINIYSNDNIECKKINLFNNEKISYIKNFIELLFIEENINEVYLDIDNPISANTPEQFKDLEKYININIKFTEKYINIANNIKNILNLKDYTCIHLRLENDSLNWMKEQNNKNLSIDKINEIYKNKYLEQLEILKNIDHKIYICTSLMINENINNNFYKEIKLKYNLLDKNDFINQNNQNNNFRELFAIIDYIIAQDSIYFVGSDWSSFSICLNDYQLVNNKASKLINIWETIKNL